MLNSFAIPTVATEIGSQYIRITNLNSGIYRLSYSGTKYIYYNGNSDTTTHTVVGGSGAVILVVSKYSTTYWHWYYVNGTDTATSTAIYSGQTTTAAGTVNNAGYLKDISRTIGNASFTLTLNGTTIGNDFTANATTDKTYTLTNIVQDSANGSNGNLLVHNGTAHTGAWTTKYEPNIGLNGASNKKVLSLSNIGDMEFYAPITAGTSGQFIKSNGSGNAPTWETFGTLTGKFGTSSDSSTLSSTFTANSNATMYIPNTSACTTGASTAAKTGNAAWFSLEKGARVSVVFSNKNTASNPTLNINSTGAKNIFYGGNQITSSNLGLLNGYCEFVYDGTQYQLIDSNQMADATSMTISGSDLLLKDKLGNTLSTVAIPDTGITDATTDGFGNAVVDFSIDDDNRTLYGKKERFVADTPLVVCETANNVAAKTAISADLTLLSSNKTTLIVIFNQQNLVGTPTFNLTYNGGSSSTGALPIYYNGAQITSSNYTILFGTVLFTYKETYWELTSTTVEPFNGIKDIKNTNSIRITALNSGIYRLFYYNNDFSIYQNGVSNSASSNPGLASGGNILLFVNKQGDYWHWFYVNTSVAGAYPLIGFGYSSLSTGNANTKGLGSLLTSVNIDGINATNSGYVNRYALCSTNANAAAKTANVSNGLYSLSTGSSVRVKFTNANTANNPTLSISSTAAKNIFYKGSQITTGDEKYLLAGVVDFVYDGTQYHLVGNSPTIDISGKVDKETYYEANFTDSGYIFSGIDTSEGAVQIMTATFDSESVPSTNDSASMLMETYDSIYALVIPEFDTNGDPIGQQGLTVGNSAAALSSADGSTYMTHATVDSVGAGVIAQNAGGTTLSQIVAKTDGTNTIQSTSGTNVSGGMNVSGTITVARNGTTNSSTSHSIVLTNGRNSITIMLDANGDLSIN